MHCHSLRCYMSNSLGGLSVYSRSLGGKGKMSIA